MTEHDYDYESQAAEATAYLGQFEGRVLRQFLTQIVEPEFNVAYLVLDDRAFAIQGRIGGEVLEIVPVEDVPSEGATGDMAVKSFAPFSIFLDRRIIQARSVGSAWNGHGFECSFEGLPDRTMIVQSIYAGEKPPDYEDCLRLGIGCYFFDATSDRQGRV